jgi:hypothetical protein
MINYHKVSAILIIILLFSLAGSLYYAGSEIGKRDADIDALKRVIYIDSLFCTEESLCINFEGKRISEQTYNQLQIFCDKYSDMDLCEEFKLSREKYG